MSVCGHYVHVHTWFAIPRSKGGYDVYKYTVGQFLSIIIIILKRLFTTSYTSNRKTSASVKSQTILLMYNIFYLVMLLTLHRNTSNFLKHETRWLIRIIENDWIGIHVVNYKTIVMVTIFVGDEGGSYRALMSIKVTCVDIIPPRK